MSQFQKLLTFGVVATLLTACTLSEPETKDPESVDTSSDNISVTAPAPYDQISSPVTIEGEARVFESVFQYRVKDADGNVLAEGSGYANSPDIGQFGPFSVSANFSQPATNTGVVEVFVYSAKDGSEADLVSIPVEFVAN